MMYQFITTVFMQSICRLKAFKRNFIRGYKVYFGLLHIGDYEPSFNHAFSEVNPFAVKRFFFPHISEHIQFLATVAAHPAGNTSR